jgi:succinate dehydrogenase/fumarate reductase flavoprotein subunit
MKARYASPITAQSDAVNVTNTGDGHSMALALGGSVVNGDLVHGPIMRFVAPARPSLISRVPPYTWVGKCATFAMAHAPQAAIRPLLMSFVTTVLGPDPGLYRAGAVLVNRSGARFTNEMDKPAHDLVTQPEGFGYIVMDSTMAAQFSGWPNFVSTAPNVAYAYLPDYKRNRPDIYHEAPTIGQLAAKLHMDEEVLAASMKTGGAAGQPLTTPPFVALGPVRSYVVLAEGGLMVTDSHEVVGSNGLAIPGLYAAGSAGQGGLLLYGHGHHLAWAFVSGRRAGRHAAAAAAH